MWFFSRCGATVRLVVTRLRLLVEHESLGAVSVELLAAGALVVDVRARSRLEQAIGLARTSERVLCAPELFLVVAGTANGYVGRTVALVRFRVQNLNKKNVRRGFRQPTPTYQVVVATHRHLVRVGADRVEPAASPNVVSVP